MMKAILLSVIICMASLFCIPYAGAETLVIPGSGNPEFILGQLAKAFNAKQGAHQAVVPETVGTAGAIRSVSEGTASLARVGRPLKDAERAGGISYSPLGRDPVVFVAGAGVSVGKVGMSRLIDVYAGKVSNWRELGGSPGQIRAIGREVTDASRQVIAREVPEFGDMKIHENVKVVHLDSQMIELLDRFPTSLGFLNRSALFGAHTKLVPLALDSMELPPDSSGLGRYPLWMEFGLIYKGSDLTDAGREFLKFVKSPEGENILRAYGVEPIASM